LSEHVEHKPVHNSSEFLYRFQETRDPACDAVALASCIVRVYLCGEWERLLGSEPEAALLVRPIAGLLNSAKVSSRALVGRNDGIEDIVEINAPIHDIYNQHSQRRLRIISSGRKALERHIVGRIQVETCR
jgi:hypothetical protein